MKQYTIERAKKTYGEKTLFQNLAMHISTKDRIGLIGINGTGKSTLMKIVGRLDEWDEGEVKHPRDYSITYLEQAPHFEGTHTIAEQIFSAATPLFQLIRQYEETVAKLANDYNEALQDRLFKLQQEMDAKDGWSLTSKAEAMLSKMGLPTMQKKMTELSGGQQKRVALVQCLLEEPDLLLLDEPTNHLDEDAVRWLEQYLINYPNAILFVTHDRYFLDNVANRMFELSGGTLYEYNGNYGDFLAQKAEREREEEVQAAKWKNLYRRELEWIRRGAKARTTKQKARIQRFEQLEDNRPGASSGQLEVNLTASRLGKQVFELENVTQSYGDRPLFAPFSTIVQKGDRIGVVGRNGAGKSTLINMIAGDIQPTGGTIITGQTVQIGYFRQTPVDMDENLRMVDYLKQAKQAIRLADGQVVSPTQLLEQFMFPSHTHGTYIYKLSGGERKRLYLVYLLMMQPNVLILDEPTNDLDTETLTVLEAYLEQFPGTVITVSHDRYFLDKVVDTLWVITDERRVETYLGDYSDYLAERKAADQQAAKEAVVAATPAQPVKKESSKKLTYKETKEYEALEGEIAALEAAIEQTYADLEAAAADYTKAADLQKQLEQQEEERDTKMMRWLELEEKLEG